MKIIVIIPNEAYRGNAGARIRYLRLADALRDLGCDIDLVPIADFDPAIDRADAILISKCYDARSILAVRRARDQGMLVGIDLFDDVFSQSHDARLERFRRWLAQILPRLDFATVSTPALSEFLGRTAPGLPQATVADSAPQIDMGELAATLDRKQQDIREKCLSIGWFGIGDHPFFPVGLTDLSAYSWSLMEVQRASGRSVTLEVLTNKRALGSSGLHLLANLPVDVRIEEWSEQAEAEMLDRLFAVFLPVNGQSFSAAKSMNRAITALCAGCQVLSAGFDLYAPFSDFIYREPRALIADLDTRRMRLRPDRLQAFAQVLDREASRDRQAKRLVGLLASLASHQQDPAAPVRLIGARPAADPSMMLTGEDLISVALPMAPAPHRRQADVEIQWNAGRELRLWIDSRLIDRLTAESRRKSVRATTSSGKSCLVTGGSPTVAADSSMPLPEQLAQYQHLLEQATTAILSAFGPVDLFLDEQSPLPFRTVHPWLA